MLLKGMTWELPLSKLPGVLHKLIMISKYKTIPVSESSDRKYH